MAEQVVIQVDRRVFFTMMLIGGVVPGFALSIGADIVRGEPLDTWQGVVLIVAALATFASWTAFLLRGNWGRRG